MTANQLPRCTPEAQGISSAALLAFVEALERIPEMHSLMLLRHGCGVWTAADTFVLTLRYYETPVYDTHTFQFEGDRLLLKGGVNVAFGPKEYPPVQGRLA
jgi:hypothetical protein